MAEVWTWVARSGQSISDAWAGLKLGSNSAGAALRGFCEGCVFFFHARPSVREEGTDWNRPVRKMNGGIRKPAPLNTARVRHPVFKISLKLVQQFRYAGFSSMRTHQ